MTDTRAVADRAAAVLARDDRVLLVYLFGSSAHGGGAPVGDVDLAVLFDRAVGLAELMRLRADLVSGVRAPIDLVALNTAPIVLAHEIADTGICLFARNPDVETAFVVRARSRYLDFKPYREAQWRLAGERLAERRGTPA